MIVLRLSGVNVEPRLLLFIKPNMGYSQGHAVVPPGVPPSPLVCYDAASSGSINSWLINVVGLVAGVTMDGLVIPYQPPIE